MKYLIVFSIFILIMGLVYIMVSGEDAMINIVSSLFAMILYGLIKGILIVINERDFLSYYLDKSFILLLGLWASKSVDYIMIKLIIMICMLLIYEVALNLGLNYSRKNRKFIKYN